MLTILNLASRNVTRHAVVWAVVGVAGCYWRRVDFHEILDQIHILHHGLPSQSPTRVHSHHASLRVDCDLAPTRAPEPNAKLKAILMETLPASTCGIVDMPAIGTRTRHGRREGSAGQRIHIATQS